MLTVGYSSFYVLSDDTAPVTRGSTVNYTCNAVRDIYIYLGPSSLPLQVGEQARCGTTSARPPTKLTLGTPFGVAPFSPPGTDRSRRTYKYFILKSFCDSQSIVFDMMVLRCAVEAMWAVGLDMAEAVALVASLLSVDS